ncbi:Cys-tRNA(Pro) deacylase [Glaciecola sp. MH2013]|uniref:Cys-tRNA(Pro) deacylase n=1 Tax=Glaciecola sp. MH2013 TaxID=2785524 RepID=UPI0018A00428|nr:Cys-tRNA(Pro) deacylase [Glaciecola sp. MH2013]MBF7071910.1 Cys-tRNA(Pro) deacylase [Glaciecola sp. MH2013]
MTPAVNILKKQKQTYELLQYEHEAGAESYASEAAEKLNLPVQAVFKTLLVELDTDELVVALLPADSKLSMKKLAKACGVKKAKMADAQKVQKVTGYVLGGVSPFGQKRRLNTIIDSSAQNQSRIFVSGGRRGLEIAVTAQVIERLLNASFIDLKAL